ncbi:MAG: type II toxin-antitoxin system RelE/ParE family toxin [Nitrospirota bacterium]
MVKIVYSERFLKDLKKIKNTIYHKRIKEFSFETLLNMKNYKNINNLKQLRGSDHYYRIRIGVYRIGIKIEPHKTTLMRVLHRKDIHKFFPPS